MMIEHGDMVGFLEEEESRTKYFMEELCRFKKWVLNHCPLIVDNPFKNDMVWKLDSQSEFSLLFQFEEIVLIFPF